MANSIKRWNGTTFDSIYSALVGTANEIAVTTTSGVDTVAFPTNVIKSGTGYFRITNTGVSSTAAGVSRLEFGVVSGAPRMVLEDSSNGTVWVVDNFGGTFRIFAGGTERYNYTTSAFTTQGSIGVVAGGTVQGTRLISTVATGTAPLTVTSTTNVTNLNADQLDGCHIVTSTTAPTISTNPGLGTGSTHTASWMYIGGTSTGSIGHLSLQGQITLGTSPTIGDLRITLPNSFTFANYVGPGTARCGTLGMRSASVGYSGFMRMESNTVARAIVQNSGTTTQVYAQDAQLGASVPGVWVSGDSMVYNIQCQVVYP